MNKEPLISVIVPIYKVEPYIHRCVDSIINQTYSHLEIILVDDGSPDACGSICDDYASKDARIKVIHQVNAGLSAARNAGLDICGGEYIGFVDSDDCIHPEMYERLYQDICDNHVKLSICQVNQFYKEVPSVDNSQVTTVKDKEFVILKSMIDSIWWAAWDKLYHKSLFTTLRYPKGKTNEDYPITMQIFDLCDRIAINNNKLYNYCIRENSICTSPLNIRKFDQIDNSEFVVDYMSERHVAWKTAAEYVYFTALLKLLSLTDADSTRSFEKQKQQILKLIKKNIAAIIKNPYILNKQKIMLLAAFIHPSCFQQINKLYYYKRRGLENGKSQSVDNNTCI